VLSSRHRRAFPRPRPPAMARQFNTAHANRAEWHYTLPPLQRLPPGTEQLVHDRFYFVLHAPRQSGKTTCVMALADNTQRRPARPSPQPLSGVSGPKKAPYPGENRICSHPRPPAPRAPAAISCKKPCRYSRTEFVHGVAACGKLVLPDRVRAQGPAQGRLLPQARGFGLTRPCSRSCACLPPQRRTRGQTKPAATDPEGLARHGRAWPLWAGTDGDPAADAPQYHGHRDQASASASAGRAGQAQAQVQVQLPVRWHASPGRASSCRRSLARR